MKALKAFIIPFEAPQRSVKMKIEVNFYFNKFKFLKCTGWKELTFGDQSIRVLGLQIWNQLLETLKAKLPV